MDDAGFGVERGDRFGAEKFAARGVDFFHGHVGVDLAEHVDDEIATLVDLGDDAVGLEVVVGGDSRPRPGRGVAALQGTVGEHVGAFVGAEPSDDDAAGVGVGGGGNGRVDGDDDARHVLGRRFGAQVDDPFALPKRVGAFGNHFAVEFLAAERGTGIDARDFGNEGGREIGGVVGSASAGEGGGGIGHDAFQCRVGAWRRGDDLAGIGAETEPELQHVPGARRALPAAELVAPGGVELRTAQAFRILGGKELRDRAVRPDELAFRDFEVRAFVRCVDRHQAGDALDHDGADMGLRRTNEGNAAGGRFVRPEPERDRAHPLGASARFAGAAAAEIGPGAPGLA